MRQQRQDDLRTRKSGRAQQGMDLLAEAAARDEHETLAPLGELVGELHGDPAAERVADYARALDVEGDEQVADAGGVCTERVVPARLGRITVAHEVGRDHGVVLGQQLNRLVPLARPSGNAMNQDEHGALPGDVEVHPVPVERDLGPLDRRDYTYVPVAPASRWISGGALRSRR